MGRIDEAGVWELPPPAPAPLPTVPVEWRYDGHWGWHNQDTVIFLTKTWQAKAGHVYLVTGCVGAISMTGTTFKPRAFFVLINGSMPWRSPVGAVHDGGKVNAYHMLPMPILTNWTATADGEAKLEVGMSRDPSKDQDWELAPGVHNVSVLDLGALT